MRLRSPSFVVFVAAVTLSVCMLILLTKRDSILPSQTTQQPPATEEGANAPRETLANSPSKSPTPVQGSGTLAAGGGQAASASTTDPLVMDRYAKAPVLAEREEVATVQGRSGTRRLRLVRDDSFKYPLLRVEDEFTGDGGARVLVRQTVAVADHVMVSVKDEKANGASLEKLIHETGATVRRKMRASGVWLVAYPDADMDTVTAARATLGRLDGMVRSVDLDYVVHTCVLPNDTSFSSLWGMHNTGQSGGTPDADIDAPEAWDMHTGSLAVKVGVIDTGIDHTHPDLAANIWINPSEIAGNSIDDDGNGFIDDIRGWDFVNNDNNAFDDQYHGTHCAGTIGGVGNNGQGVAGVCWTVSLVPLKFLNSSGSGAISDATEAVAYATSIGVHLTSNSWGGGGYNQAFKDALDASHAAGILFVAAAGNSNANNDLGGFFPSNYDSPCVISVAATTRTDAKSSFSSYGLTTVDLGAPGSEIFSAQPGGLYQNLNGTSMATPHVAGACALLKAFKPSLTHLEIKDAIFASVDVTPAMSGITVTGGRLNVHKALLMLDDLSVSPTVTFQAKGSAGGPFSPTLQTYTVANTDALTPVTWTAASGAPWISVSPASGTLAAGSSATVYATFNSEASNLPAGVHVGAVIFSNLTSGVSFTRSVRLAVGQVDHFTEQFSTLNDTDNQSWLFTPDGSDSFYSVIRTTGVTAFPTNPTGGTNLPLGDNNAISVNPSGGQTVSLYGTAYASFFVGSNGNLMFGGSDTASAESLAAHFALPRVSALFDDLNPAGGGTVSWIQLPDRVAVTYQNVPQTGTADSNSFQIELFTDGRIRVTCLGIAATDGLIGLSRGLGTPAGFVTSDFSTYPTTAPMPDILVEVPVMATEGAGTLPGAGMVTIPAPAVTDISVTLISSNPAEASVPANVTIPAGSASAPFSITIGNDTGIDGPQSVVISAAAAGFQSGAGATTVEDDDGAGTLTLSAPATASEGAGTLLGTLTTSVAPAGPLSVLLNSTDTTEITVPATVVIPAGQTSITFPITVINDIQIDGTQTATITASVTGWTGGTATISVFDGETTNLAMTLPASIAEGATGTGSVLISGTLPAPLVVSLTSDTPSRLTVPATVTIATGSTSATFPLTTVNNTLTDGSAVVTVGATAAAFTATNATTTVRDNDVHHFDINPIPSPAIRGVPFSVTITAKDVNDLTITTFTGTASLSATGTGGPVSITPTTTTAFLSGVWTGNVTVNSFASNVILTATHASGATGSSNPFNVGTGPVTRFSWNTVPAPQTAGVPFAATVTALDAGNNTVTGFNGAAALRGYVYGPDTSSIVITEVNPNTPDSIELMNVGTSARDISGWRIYYYDFDTGATSSKTFVIPAGTICPAGQVFRLQEGGSAPGTFPLFSTGANINWVSGSSQTVGVLLHDSADNPVDFMCASGLAASAITSPGPIPAAQWSGGQVPSSTNTAFGYVRLGNSDGNVAADWTTTTPSIGTANAGLSAPFAPQISVPILPLSARFASGVWAGNVIALQAATQMRLQAEDSAGRTGESNSFNVNGSAAAEISVEHPALNPLADGATTVDFGGAALGGEPAARTFVMRNVGPLPLTITGITGDGTDVASFAFPSLAGIAIPPAGSLTFTVQFSAASAGPKTAAIHIASDDSDENPFDISLTGTGIAAPEIKVEQPSGTDRADGSGTIAFGDAVLGTPVVRTLTIRNTGGVTLNLGTISIDGTNGGDFSAGSPASATVAPGGSTTLDVTFNASSHGARSAFLRIASNDLNENPFDLMLTGIGSAPPGLLRLARNINATGASPGITAANTAVMGNILYFAANSAETGTELWRTDGTAAGTALVRDIAPGTGSSSPANFTVVGNTLFFAATNGSNGIELWKTDGTSAGTVMVRDIFPGTSSSTPANLRNVAGTLFFSASDSTANGTELWKSDGTPGGTVMVLNINATANTGSSPANFTAVGSTLFFTANDGINGVELWKSDGTAAGTVLAANIVPGSGTSSPANLVAVGGTLFFSANDGSAGTELWKSDSISGVTELVLDINGGSASSSPAGLVNAGGTLFFRATTSANGTELWKSDGTPGGTVMVRDINPGTASSTPSSLLAVGTVVYFSANDGTNGIELWKSDGTSGGTVMVANISPGAGFSSPANLTRVANKIYFSASISGSGTELWQLDLDSGIVSFVEEINPGTGSSSPSVMFDLGGLLVFLANDGANGIELWSSDGTAGGTGMIVDIVPGDGNAAPANFRVLNGAVVFSATDGVNGAELWRSDGLPGGTSMVRDIFSGLTGSNPGAGVAIGTTLFFPATDSAGGTELWRTDGTNAGTVRVRDIFGGASGSSPTNLARVGTTLYFSASDSTANGAEIWKSDGTSAGTVMVANINATANGASSPGNLTDYNGTLVFTANNGTNGVELWKSDGTAGGTTLVADISTGTAGSSPANFRVVGSTLYFTATTPATGNELWRTDGTPGGTTLVADISAGTAGSSPSNLTVLGSTLYFSATNSANGRELWKTDGTPGGTVLAVDISPGTGSSSPNNITVVDSMLFFSAFTSANGTELWKSDGTSAGTSMVADINAGTASSSPTNLTNAYGTLYFAATTAANGVELWRSDGTSGGTSLVGDIRPGSPGSSPANLTVLDSRLLFSAIGPDLGSELWTVDLPAEIVVEQPTGVRRVDGLFVWDGTTVVIGGVFSTTVTVRNIGGSPLTGLSISKAGPHAGDFTVGSPGTTILAAGASTTFTVAFSPSAPGARNAAIHIASNDTDENPFDIGLTGTGVTQQQNWRLQYFGSSANSGDGADGHDFDGDGLNNFTEFCLRTDPTLASRPQQSVERNGSNLELTYTRAKAAVLDGVVFAVKWNDDLSHGSWSEAGVTESVLIDDGIDQVVKAIAPAGPNGHRFLHLETTKP